jgi:glyoxylase-like metal-dependent hydrolase (beta-lactamase superfamily II)
MYTTNKQKRHFTMKIAENITYLTAIQDDTRIRIFRRTFPDMEDFAGMYVDAYAIISERYVVICDTLLCPNDMQAVMENVRPELATGRQLLVINSHADWDHAWGNCYFTGRQNAPLLAHHHCRERLQSAEAQAELAAYQKRDTTFRNVALTAPTLTFAHDLTLYGGDLTLTLFPAPGHTSDSCALWIPELRLLLAFDSLEAPFPLLESAAGVQPLMTTLQRFLALEPLHVLCSHSTADNTLIHKNLGYMQTLVRRTLQLTHRPTEAELEHGSALIASPFAEFGEEDDGTGTSAFYRQAHENNIRFIINAEIPKENPSRELPLS